jgi:hypothetical protein
MDELLRVRSVAEMNAIPLEDALAPATSEDQVPAGVFLYVRNRSHHQRAITLPDAAPALVHTAAIPPAKRRRRWHRPVPTDMIFGPLPAAGAVSYPAGLGGLRVAAFTPPS